MVSKIIDGKAIASNMNIKAREWLLAHAAEPKVTVYMIGEYEPSNIYIRNKQKTLKEVGIVLDIVRFAGNEYESTIIDAIKASDSDTSVCGIFIQLPIPETYTLKRFLDCISTAKDIDGLKPENVGDLCLRAPLLRPCTAFGVIHLLKTVVDDLKGKTVCIVGASNLVGRPLAMECLLEGCTTIVCHRFTKNLKSHTLAADIIISATGQINIITSDMVSNGTIVIDVGISRKDDGTLCGDVDFQNVKNKVSYITPVPGGVGPMTIAMLIQNILIAYNTNRLARSKESAVTRV